MEEAVRVGGRDAAVPAALLVLGTVELALLGTPGWIPSVGLEAVSALALVFRRTHPLVAAPLAAIVLMVIPATGTRMDEAATPILFYIVAIYSLGRYLAGHSGMVALALTLLLIFADFYFLNSPDHDATDIIFVLALAIPPFVFGRISRKLVMQSELLARQSEQLRDQAVRDERDRIARELHDVIAHSVSAMVVQTAAAQDLVRTHPDRAASMLQGVADTGRRALEETGRLLHLIRDDADELGLRPAPGLADLPELVDSFRESGLQVSDELSLPADPLPGGVDVSAYRVVQELLTNALKYAAGPARLEVDAGDDRLRISCANAVGGATGASGSGLGLQGMAERVGQLGGTLNRSSSNGRFAVEVDIPLAREVAT